MVTESVAHRNSLPVGPPVTERDAADAKPGADADKHANPDADPGRHVARAVILSAGAGTRVKLTRRPSGSGDFVSSRC